MTPETLNRAVAEACGIPPMFYLMKCGLYYRPRGAGYTSCRSEAGLYSEEEAKKSVYPHDEPVTMHPAPDPDYGSDLNAMHEAEKVLQGEREWEAYIQNLLKLTKGKGFVVLHATAAQRAEAFLRTLNLWKS